VNKERKIKLRVDKEFQNFEGLIKSSKNLGANKEFALELSAAVQKYKPLLIIGCPINIGFLWELLLIKLFYSSP
jgi:hypothetical protein